MRHSVILVLCIALLLASALLQLSDEGVSLLGIESPLTCFLRNWLGVRCALCGMTRSLCSLAHGDIASSLQYHLLGPGVFAFLCLQIPYRIYALAIHPRPMNAKVTKLNFGLATALIIAILVNWLIYLGGLIL